TPRSSELATIRPRIDTPKTSSLRIAMPPSARRVVVDVVRDHRLELVDVDFLDVVLAARPGAGLQAHDAAKDLDRALQQKQRAGDRDHRLERIDRRPLGSDRRVLADRERLARVL